MLSLFLLHIIITFLCYWTGYLFYRFISGKVENIPATFYLIGGLIFLTLISQILVIFFPINYYIQTILVVVVVLSAIIERKEFKKIFKTLFNELQSYPLSLKLLFILLWILIVMINAGPILMDDSESYHMQMVKWISEYGTVPGLVNLHERFGFNSSWFSSIALFSFPSGRVGSYTVLNGVLSLWFCFYLFSTHARLVKENKKQIAISILLLLALSIVIWPLIRGNAASTNYDFITTLLATILFIESYIKIDATKEFTNKAEWIIWPVYLFTVRIINFPLLLLTLFVLILVIKKREWKSLIIPIIISGLLLLPFLIRNIIISGYPFFPSTSFNFFNVDWKADPLMIDELLRYIKYYGRVSTTYLDIEQTAVLGFPEWISSWFKFLFKYDKMIILVGCFGLIITSFLILFKKWKQNFYTNFFILVFVAWLISWLFISPDPRFVYGCFLAGSFLLIHQILNISKNITFLKSASQITITLIIIAVSYSVILKPINQPHYRNWLMSIEIPKPPLKEIEIDQVKFFIPEPINNNWNARCYDAPLPCLYKIDVNLKLRGKNIQSGFRLEK